MKLEHVIESQQFTVPFLMALFDRARQMERLVASKLDVLFLCVDGVTQATYEKTRRGGKLSMVLDFGRRLVRARQRQGSRYPLIEFRTLASKHNFSELPALLRLAEDIGADHFTLKKLMRTQHFQGPEPDQELKSLQGNLAWYPKEPGTLPAAAPRPSAQPGPLRCGAPTYAPALNANNDLVFCCHAQEEGETFGNVTRTSFRKVWRSASARRKRLAFLQQEGTNTSTCKSCFFRSYHQTRILFTVPLQPLPADISVARPVSKDEFLQAWEVNKTERPAA